MYTFNHENDLNIWVKLIDLYVIVKVW